MKLVLKYLKPFLGGVVLSLIFLFAQNITELALPNMMSSIINVGLQQSGIQTGSPSIIMEDSMKLAQLFMTDSEKANVSSMYALKQPGDTDPSTNRPYSSDYPKLAGSFYAKVPETSDESQSNMAFGSSFYSLMQYARPKTAAPPKEEEATRPNIIDYKQYLAEVEAIPQSQRMSLRDQYLEEIPPTTILNSGIAMARSILEEAGANTAAIQRAYIYRTGLVMMLIALFSGFATVLVSYFSSRISSGFGRDLRKALFDKIEGFSANEFDHFSTASLITRCTNDVTTVQMLTGMGIRMLFSAPITGIGGIILAVRTSLSMSWIIALAVIVQIGLVMTITSIAFPKFSIIQKLTDKINLVARENLSGLMVVRAFNTQHKEKERFAGTNNELLSTELFINRCMSIMMPGMTIVMNGVSLLIIWVGAHQIAVSQIQVGDMMAFMQYAMMILFAFMGISMMFQILPRALISIRRINEVLATEITVNDPEQPVKFGEGSHGVVEFNNVSFRYPEATNNALTNISFIAQPGQTTAIIGSTGSGKSTIANLLLRFYDTTEGNIKVDGNDIRDVSQFDLREKIGYIPQKAVLLSGTIDSNLRYGFQDADPDLIEWAAKVAQARGFIIAKEDGYDLQISQGGANVSGGQKQRLSIARALVKKPEILIFDDSFSALDFKTDTTLRAALKQESQGSTVIIVAQRVSTIMHAEQIIVLDKGEIVGKGTHAELLEKCPEYYEIASSQLSAEELSA